MHLLVPFAAPLSDPGRLAMRELALPNLAALLPQLGEAACDTADEMSLSAPHERALARTLGLAVADGLVPMAALEAARAGLDVAGRAWARLTPAHWRLGAERVALADPAALALDEAQSRALFDAVRELFESEGFELHWHAPTAWFASHPSLAELPSASLDRVIGRHIDAWLNAGPRARLLRRLQNEAQMLLHTHPLNAEREARGELTVNSLWISGTGPAPSVLTASDDLVLDDRLRAPALNEDWLAWSRAWQALDAEVLADARGRVRRGDALTLTLCGERSALTLQPRARSLFARLGDAFRRPDAIALLETL